MRAANNLVLMFFTIKSICISCESQNVKEKVEKRVDWAKERPCSVILRSPRVTNWGTWLDYFSTCPNGTFVVGFQLKTDPFHGNHNDGMKADNTAVNGVRLFCARENKDPKSSIGNKRGYNCQSHVLVSNITNNVQKWGRWGQLFFCEVNHFAVGFQLRVRKALPNGAGYGFKVDDVGTTNLRLLCSDGSVLEGDGRNEWGQWTRNKICPKRHAICSLKTQVEGNQFFLDDTALNNVDTGCCPLSQSFSLGKEERKLRSTQPDNRGLESQSELNHLLTERSDRTRMLSYDYLILLKSKMMSFLQDPST